MATNLDLLVELCRLVGGRVPVWTQGPGGNISWKERTPGGHTLHIKSSGLRLDEVRANAGLTRVDLEAFGALSVAAGIAIGSVPTEAQEQDYVNALKAATNTAQAGQARPSMETIFHAALPAPFVVHAHSLAALLMAHEVSKAPGPVEAWLKSHAPGPVAFLPPLRPGLRLGWEVAKRRDAAAIVLQNHGVILQVSSRADVEAWQRLEVNFCRTFGFPRLAALLEAPAVTSQATSGFLKAIPFRLYFPDTAVFLQRLGACLSPLSRRSGAEPVYLIKANDRDMGEIWLAQQILFSECPSLAELPPEIAQTVASLPAEKIRQAKNAS